MISEILLKGKENARTMADLMRMTNLPKRDLQRMIAFERQQGALILSSTTPPGGFFKPGSSDDLREYVHSMDARAKSTFRACMAARKALREMEERERGQLTLTENAPDAAPER